MEFIRTEDINYVSIQHLKQFNGVHLFFLSDIVSFYFAQRPRLYEAVVDEVKSPEKALPVTYD